VRVKNNQILHFNKIEKLNSDFQALFADLALENEHPVDKSIIRGLQSNLRDQSLALKGLGGSVDPIDAPMIEEYQSRLSEVRKQISHTVGPGDVHSLWPLVAKLLAHHETLSDFVYGSVKT
jgi:hypothetical protein